MKPDHNHSLKATFKLTGSAFLAQWAARQSHKLTGLFYPLISQQGAEWFAYNIKLFNSII